MSDDMDYVNCTKLMIAANSPDNDFADLESVREWIETDHLFKILDAIGRDREALNSAILAMKHPDTFLATCDKEVPDVCFTFFMWATLAQENLDSLLTWWNQSDFNARQRRVNA
jgi:hypothetical protein